MWRLADGAVDLNSPYSYLMLCEHFSETCAVAELDGTVGAFATGFRLPADPETIFIWQIAVGAAARGRGIGARLLDHIVDSQPPGTVRHLEATVTPDNEASEALFRGFARRRGAPCRTGPIFDRSDFPDDSHEPEIRFRIGPF